MASYLDSSVDEVIPETPPANPGAGAIPKSSWRRRVASSSEDDDDEKELTGDRAFVPESSDSDSGEDLRKKPTRKMVGRSFDDSPVVRSVKTKKILSIESSDEDEAGTNDQSSEGTEEDAYPDKAKKASRRVVSLDSSDDEDFQAENVKAKNTRKVASEDSSDDEKFQAKTEKVKNTLESSDDEDFRAGIDRQAKNTRKIVSLESSDDEEPPVEDHGDSSVLSGEEEEDSDTTEDEEDNDDDYVDSEGDDGDDSIVEIPVVNKAPKVVTKPLETREAPKVEAPSKKTISPPTQTVKPGPQKSLSPTELFDLESQLQKASKVVENNTRLYNNSKSKLPDNGVKLAQFIEDAKAREAVLKAKISAAKENLGAGTASFVDVKRLDDLHRMRRLKSQQFATVRANSLPDGGEGMRRDIEQLNKQIMDLELKVKVFNPKYQPPPIVPHNVLQDINKPREIVVLNNPPAKSTWDKIREGIMSSWGGNTAEDRMLEQGPAANRLYGGRMNEFRHQEAVAATQDAMKRIHKSLETMPAEADEEDAPSGLKSSITLFPHQNQGLAWMIWRETQDPPGGILADDMGLGKTLSLISLILKQKEILEANSNADSASEQDWMAKGGKNLVRSKGTLVICPASLMGHWQEEVKKRLKKDTLRVMIYHGSSRDISAKHLARYDIVVTTYETARSEICKATPEPEGKKSSRLDDLKPIDLNLVDAKGAILLQIAWERIILDEAHIIRNPTSKAAKAICRLRASKRWAVSGTPIQNKELDMYSLIRFLRCSPFDEYNVWKRWVDKSPMGQERMKALVKVLVLRRVKDQISIATGRKIVELPEKTVEEHRMQLDEEERKVYDEVFSFSQQAMINYMAKHAEKEEDNAFIKKVADNGYKFDPKMAVNFHGEATEVKAPSDGKTNGITSKFNASNTDIKAHHLLVLLLRLRQICNHPGLIKTMLDAESKAVEGLDASECSEDLDLVNQLANMSLAKGALKTKADDDNEVMDKILDVANPVFKEKRPSSKIITVLQKLKALKKLHRDTGVMEKAVIVSQWTSMLNIMRSHVSELGMKVAEINGSVKISTRSDIVTDFNAVGKGAQVLLLSLGAGGVGLNLVGANHLFLIDMHWNPQLEAQACDRIYRVGQTKPVTIHKFLCENTVESRILDLQRKKLDLANNVLTGAKRTNANKLTLDDLKMLFDITKK